MCSISWPICVNRGKARDQGEFAQRVDGGKEEGEESERWQENRRGWGVVEVAVCVATHLFIEIASAYRNRAIHKGKVKRKQ